MMTMIDNLGGFWVGWLGGWGGFNMAQQSHHFFLVVSNSNTPQRLLSRRVDMRHAFMSSKVWMPMKDSASLLREFFWHVNQK